MYCAANIYSFTLTHTNRHKYAHKSSKLRLLPPLVNSFTYETNKRKANAATTTTETDTENSNDSFFGVFDFSCELNLKRVTSFKLRVFLFAYTI